MRRERKQDPVPGEHRSVLTEGRPGTGTRDGPLGFRSAARICEGSAVRHGRLAVPKEDAAKTGLQWACQAHLVKTPRIEESSSQ